MKGGIKCQAIYLIVREYTYAHAPYTATEHQAYLTQTHLKSRHDFFRLQYKHTEVFPINRSVRNLPIGLPISAHLF